MAHFDAVLQLLNNIYVHIIKVKVLVYSLVLAVAATHTTLQASHYLLVRELCQTFNAEFPSAAHFAHLCIDLLSVQSGSNQGFIPCLRVLFCCLCSLTWAGFEPTRPGMEVQCQCQCPLNHKVPLTCMNPHFTRSPGRWWNVWRPDHTGMPQYHFKFFLPGDSLRLPGWRGSGSTT